MDLNIQISWLSLIPPLIVFITAFWAKQVLVALALGIISGSLVITHFSLIDSAQIIGRYSFNQITDPDTIFVFCFLAALGALTTLINYTGGTLAYGKKIKKSLSDARSAELASISLSSLLCFDDFFSSITTGCIMKPLTDHFCIARVKLAFLIDAMAAPLAILIPISSWIAMLMMQLNKAGIAETITATTTIIGDPFTTYLKIIPFIFYSFIIVFSTIFIVMRRISFGTMHTHERIAQLTGNLFGGKQEPIQQTSCPPSNQGSIRDFVIPLLFLLIAIISTLLYTGNAKIFGGTAALGAALVNAPIFLSLAIGSATALLASLVFFTVKQLITLKVVPRLLFDGIKPMGHVMLILLSAWIFSSLMVNDLKSGNYLASLLINKISIGFLPAICFVLATITSISVGSSWGTIAILTPLAVPMLLSFTHLTVPLYAESIPLLLPVLGAIFSGAVAGDHISPLSSTTIMSSTSSGANHFDHVKTQLEYVTPALMASCIGYLLCGLFTPLYGAWIALALSLPASIAISFLGLSVLNQMKPKI